MKITELLESAEPKSSSPIVYVDMDGVLADLYNHAATLHDVDHYNNMTPEQWESFFKDSNAYHLFRDIKPFPTANKLLNMVKNFAGGYTIFSEKPEIKEGGLYTKDMLKKRLIIAMGGKAAENIYYGNEHISLGAVQDLKQANSMAKRMIGNFGMGDKLEVFFNEDIDDDSNPFLGRSLALGDKYSEHTRDMMDRESLGLVKEAYNLKGIPKVLLRNTIPVGKTKEIADDYEITPEFSYEYVDSKVITNEKPWEVKDDEGVLSNSLMPPPVVVSLIKQLVKVLGI
jgi:hypothetical protein